jgi:hypothetical protein
MSEKESLQIFGGPNETQVAYTESFPISRGNVPQEHAIKGRGSAFFSRSLGSLVLLAIPRDLIQLSYLAMNLCDAGATR